jgi:pilus assembly protein CpaF
MAIETIGNGRYEFRLDNEAGDGDYFEAVHAIHQRMLQEMDMKSIERLDTARAREAVSVGARQMVLQTYPSLLGDDRERVIKRVIDEAIGYGPIQPLIEDDDVSEVMVNAPEEIYYERDGMLYQLPHHAHHRADHRAAWTPRR